MSVTVRDAGPFEKLVGFTVSEAELETAKTKAARRLSRELKIRGFRPGKAPRPIVEATVGPERLRSEAIDEILPEKVGSVLGEAALEPAVTPQLEAVEEGEDGIQVEVRVTLWPTLDEIPEIHDRVVEVESPEVTSEELEHQLDRIRDQFAQLETVERAAGQGDYVSVDISATAGGVEVPEAAASQLLYEVGAGGFVEGMDEALVGTSAGGSITFDGELPVGFGDKAGTPVTFSVTVGEVREKRLPDLTDEWVSEMTEFDSVTELRASLLDQMSGMKKRSLQNRFRQQALDQLVETIQLELPEPLIRAEMDELLHRFGHRLEEQGVSFEDYLRVTGFGQEAFVADLRAQADRSLRTRLLLDAIADHEGLEVSEDELSSLVGAVAADPERPADPTVLREALRNTPQEKALVGDILRNKALEAIVAGARPVDETGAEVDLTVEEPVVEGDVVEGEIVEGEVVSGEIVEGDVMTAAVDTEEE